LHRARGRHNSALPVTGSGGGDGGGGGGGGTIGGATDSYTSSSGYESDTYSSSNYVETYDPSGNLACQVYGASDSSGSFSLDIADASGSDFSMDMPGYPGDPLGETFSFAVEGGTITAAFQGSITNEASATYEDDQGNTYTAPPVSVTSGTTTVGDLNFDGSGESYSCQLLRLWESTVIAGIIVADGYSVRYAPNAGAGTAGGIGATTAAIEAINLARENLAAHGC
jgi:hypothetical protein